MRASFGRMAGVVGVLVGILGIFVVSACGAATPPAIEVQDAWVRAAVVTGNMQQEGQEGQEGQNMGEQEGMMQHGGSNSAAYMTLINSGDTPDALIAAETDVAETVELHTVEMENGVMKMRPVPQIDVPAQGEQMLKPGGFHIMLLGIQHDLKDGETVTLTLTFEKSGTMDVVAPVQMLKD